MSVVMGTAGHIDHGKTSLIKALTGIDCDRLEEEKKRGITIELGFAFLPLPDGSRLGIVDVPGHERFIRNMVAGAAGIDFVLMVIAADEGVMPQTREHLEICYLMGIREGIIALTKSDIVDEEMLELVKEDVTEYFKGTFLERAPIIPVSSVTGEGLDVLRDAIIAKASALQPRHHSDIFRLPVDRVFSITGYGTIVTGTLISGKASSDDEMEIFPSHLRTRIKSIQSHGKNVEQAEPGHRTSLNLSRLEVKDIHKGDFIARPGSLFPSNRWIISLTCLPSAPRGLKQREEVHFHHGTREVQAHLFFADRDVLYPGETALVEIRFETPMAGIFGDHCVVRMFSPLRTAAGGIVLVAVPYAVKVKKLSVDMRDRLLKTPGSTAEERVQTLVEFCGMEGVEWEKLLVLTCLEEDKLDKAIQTLSRDHRVYCYHKNTKSYISAAALAYWKKCFLDRATEFHSRNPLLKGMARGYLFGGAAKDVDPKIGLFVLNQLLKEEKLIAEDDLLYRSDFSVELQVDDEELASRVLAAYRQAPLTPPMIKHFLETEKLTQKQVGPVLKMLQQKGELVKINNDLYYDASSLEEIRNAVKTWFERHTNMTPADLKEITGLARKYTIPLLEYFDNSHFTFRVGNERKLSKTHS